MIFVAKPVAVAVNHLLTRETWARERLMPYAGKTARVVFSSFSVVVRVQPDGYLAAVDESDMSQLQCDMSIYLSADAVPAFIQGGQAAAMKHAKIEGDVEFAAQLGELAEHLRWEPDEDLARLIGDAGAYRIVALARAAHARATRAGANLRDSFVEYWLDENPQWVRRAALNDFDAQLASTRDALARIEKRVARLVQRVEPSPNASARAGASPREPSH